MIKYFKIFFYPPAVTYSYKQPKEIIVNRLKEIFYNKIRLATNNDVRVMFLSEQMFAINLVLPLRFVGLMFGSTLVGEITESKGGITHIKTKARPGFGLYLLFFLTVIFTSVYFYKFISTGSRLFLFSSLVSIIIGSLLSIGMSNVMITSIRQHYERYINNDLKPISISTVSVR